jgi:all-trans-retinol 13,14-reductase
MKTIIIGSGMSGLTAGAYLARGGHEVTIYEQFPTPGGVTATVTQDGFGWDIGPLLLEGFAPGDKGRLILEELGVSEQVPVVHEDRGIVMTDFAMWKPKEYEGPCWRREHLKKIFPQEAKALDRYYRFYDHMIKLFSIARRSEGATGLAALWYKLRLLLLFLPVKSKAKWSGKQLMDHYFQSPELKTFFLGIVADFVTAPSEFPALGVPTIHLETAFDKRIPRPLIPTSWAAARCWWRLCWVPSARMAENCSPTLLLNASCLRMVALLGWSWRMDVSIKPTSSSPRAG